MWQYCHIALMKNDSSVKTVLWQYCQISFNESKIKVVLSTVPSLSCNSSRYEYPQNWYQPGPNHEPSLKQWQSWDDVQKMRISWPKASPIQWTKSGQNDWYPFAFPTHLRFAIEDISWLQHCWSSSQFCPHFLADFGHIFW